MLITAIQKRNQIEIGKKINEKELRSNPRRGLSEYQFRFGKYNKPINDMYIKNKKSLNISKNKLSIKIPVSVDKLLINLHK